MNDIKFKKLMDLESNKLLEILPWVSDSLTEEQKELLVAKYASVPEGVLYSEDKEWVKDHRCFKILQAIEFDVDEKFLKKCVLRGAHSFFRDALDIDNKEIESSKKIIEKIPDLNSAIDVQYGYMVGHHLGGLVKFNPYKIHEEGLASPEDCFNPNVLQWVLERYENVLSEDGKKKLLKMFLLNAPTEQAAKFFNKTAKEVEQKRLETKIVCMLESSCGDTNNALQMIESNKCNKYENWINESIKDAHAKPNYTIEQAQKLWDIENQTHFLCRNEQNQEESFNRNFMGLVTYYLLNEVPKEKQSQFLNFIGDSIAKVNPINLELKREFLEKFQSGECVIFGECLHFDLDANMISKLSKGIGEVDQK